MEEFIKLEEEYNRLKGEHETTLAYTRELGLENQKLRKQKNGVMEESEKLKEKKKVLEGTIKELKETNASLIDENGWIVVCKTEQEEKTKQLEMENEKLTSQYTILSNQRKELEVSAVSDITLLRGFGFLTLRMYADSPCRVLPCVLVNSSMMHSTRFLDFKFKLPPLE